MQEDQKREDVAGETEPAQQNQDAPMRLARFVRRHPAMSAIGAVGIGVLGGLELAAGVVIGAGAMAVLGRSGNTQLRERARARFGRAPEQLGQRLRERVRAVVQAARGKQPVDEARTQHSPEPTEAEVVGPASA